VGALKMREWTSWHEEAKVDNARLDKAARRNSGGQRSAKVLVSHDSTLLFKF